ncbi:uncharacterized protein LOC114296636 [Camellia sinensis]|uniref:uncharacterized protein LOC114296636 n=1 Tax=Camellia sinensis TaxID=4442 RepID=UPI001036668E|nr:uncharacterized protein LOC114296636 [Camellia sinensis]
MFKKCDATVCRVIQTYNPEDEKFNIGGAKLPLRNNDIRLIFGVQCGREKLDMTHGGKGPSDFIQRRCAKVSRISSKLIKDLLGEAICGRTERDEEDVAKLLCVYVCAKLFFATTGEHIGWAFVSVIDKLDTLQQYDWSATIRNTLIGSLNEMHNKPEKVTGCVVALLFLICEHSNIIAPERPDVTPRFCRWNIASAVGKLRAINLSSEGCFEVHCAKLVGTINECHILKVPAAAIETKECGRIRMDVEPPGVCDERRAVIETDDVGSVEPSFNCWQPAKKTKGDMQIEGGNDYDNKNTGTPTSKEKVAGKLVSRGDVLPVLFPDLLELASTPDGEDVGEEQRGVHNELITCKVRITELESQINMKDVQICELEQRVETLEKLLGRHAGNLFANLNTVIVDKDAEIARLTKQVDRLDKKVSNLEDSLDDLEVHEVTQFAVNDGSNQRTPSNSVSGKVSGSANVTSCESAQQFACPTGQPEDVRINELQLVDNDPGIEDLTDDFADGILHTTVAMGEGSCSPINAQTVAAGNVKDGAAVVVVEGHCEHPAGATSSGPKITSLVKRVKNKARREFRLSDYEYPGIFGRTQVNTNVRLGKSVEPGVIYSVEDVEVERKTWNGFGLNRRHTVWNMLKDEDRELLQRMYTLEGDGLIVWDGGHNGIQVHFTDIKDLVQQNSIHGNVIDAYGAMLTEMHKMVSGRAEYVGTSYIYTSVCSDMMRNSSAVSRAKYLNVHMKAARGCRYTVIPIYNANHWTVMACDVESGNWKHYNSMRPRRGVRDEHYNVALKVVSAVLKFQF